MATEMQALRCPKNMKLPKAVKRMAAMMNASKEDRNFFMRSMGIALHEQAQKMKSTPRENKTDRRPTHIPSSGPDTE